MLDAAKFLSQPKRYVKSLSANRPSAKRTQLQMKNNSTPNPSEMSGSKRSQKAATTSQDQVNPDDGSLDDLGYSTSDSTLSSEDEGHIHKFSHQPYVELLQALTTSKQRDEPSAKRRKHSEHNSPGESHYRNNSSIQLADVILEDEVSEPENSDAEVSTDDEDESDEDPFARQLSDKTLDILNHLIQNKALRWQKQLIRPATGWKSLIRMLPEFISTKNSDLIPKALCLKRKLSHADPLKLRHPEKLESYLIRNVFDYRDILFTGRSVDSASFLLRTYCLHIINHVLKTRDTVMKNNAKISKASEEDDSEYRDQGFTRPKALILLPTRQACARALETIVEILQPEQQENRKRFLDTFSSPDDLVDSDKPEDFKELFSGNDDDRFMVGAKVTRKTFKFFSSFYGSDIIVASPLGLHAKITANDKKKRDWDFLSSIEIVIIDQADALLAQNWENVQTVIQHLNLEPKEAHGCDFARVRRWYLDKRGKYYRQTLVFSAFATPELNGLFERSMVNVSGKIKISSENHEGVLTKLSTQVKQTFMRFDTISSSHEPDDRFRHFTASINPLLSKYSRRGRNFLSGTLIFIPSYLDFLRVQNFFCYSNEAQAITFDPADLPCISEYGNKPQNARAKSLFQNGRHPVLLYTGRAHHFYRYKLKGVRRVIIYSLPENPKFYQEIVGDYISRNVAEGMCSPDDTSAHILFSRCDALKLQSIVGAEKCLLLLQDKGDVFEFF